MDNCSWNPLGLRPEAHSQLTRNHLNEAIAEHGVEQLRMGKDEFYKMYAGPPPAPFFCDVDHSYEATKADIAWAWSVGATIICGDDHDHPTQRGTTQAVDELGGRRQLHGGLFVLQEPARQIASAARTSARRASGVELRRRGQVGRSRAIVADGRRRCRSRIRGRTGT